MAAAEAGPTDPEPPPTGEAEHYPTVNVWGKYARLGLLGVRAYGSRFRVLG